MATITNLLKRDPILHFSCVKLSFQTFAEVDPEFAKNHENELKCPWYVLNECGQVHAIQYRHNNYKPVLTDGWNDLKIFHDMPHNVEVVFGYYGKNFFRVEKFKDVPNSTQLPKFHSRSSMRFQTVHFHYQVWDDQLQSEILPLYGSLGEYLKNNRIHTLHLCDDNAESHDLLVYMANDVNNSAQLGIGWNFFCKSNGSKNGQTLRFKFHTHNNRVCHVYPIVSAASTSNTNM